MKNENSVHELSEHSVLATRAIKVKLVNVNLRFTIVRFIFVYTSITVNLVKLREIYKL